jgi:hypothetical protein
MIKINNKLFSDEMMLMLEIKSIHKIPYDKHSKYYYHIECKNYNFNIDSDAKFDIFYDDCILKIRKMKINKIYGKKMHI